MCWQSHSGATEPWGWWLGGWGATDSEEERKGTVPERAEDKKRQIEIEIERCGVRGYGPLCPAGDYRWPSELNQNCADCQGMGSATHRVPHERGVRLAQREEAEGEGCSHRVKIAFKWVFEISKNKLPLKKLNRQLIWELDGGQVKSCPLPPFLLISASSIPWHHSFSHSLTFTHRHEHWHASRYCTNTWV